jgi:hypothetical protein
MDLKTTVNGPLLPGNQGSDLAEFNIIKFVVFKHFLFIRLPANFFDNPTNLDEIITFAKKW